MPTFSLTKFLPLLIALCLLPCLFAGRAGAQVLIKSTDWSTGSFGSTTLGGAGTTTGAGDGWIDVAGNVATAGTANLLTVRGGSSSWATGTVLLRPASENVRDQREVVTFLCPGASGNGAQEILRWQSGNTEYFISVYFGTTPNVTIYRAAAGAFTQVGAAQTFTLPATGDRLVLTTDAVGASPTTLTVTLADTTTATTLVNAYSQTDSSGPQVVGQSGLSGNNTFVYQKAVTYNLASNVIAPNNAGIVYSPYNWLTSASSAETISAGAYFRTLITASTTCKVGLTIGAATPYSEAYARIDGGAWQQYIPTASGAQVWTLAMPSPSTAPNHLLEFTVKSTTETQDRWTAQTTAVQFTGLTLDAGATVSAPVLRKYRVLVYGDSITEGVRVNGFTGITNDTDRNDNTLDYSSKLGELLNAEVGVVGFGATGMTVAGSGNVPALPSAYNLLWSGQSRTFSPVPDLVIYNEGTNESGATLSAMQTAFGTVINGIGYAGTGNTFAGLNGTRHLVLRPFGGNQATNLQTIAAGFSSANVMYGNTTGFWSAADSSDGTHPYGYAHLGNIAPAVASLALPLLRNAAAATGTKRRIQ